MNATPTNESVPGPAGGGAASNAIERSLPDNLAQLAKETVELLRNELRLAKREMDEKFEQAKHGVSAMAFGGLVLAGGLLTLLAAAVIGLGEVMPYWASALLVGGIVTLIGGAMLGKGRQNLKPENLEPERTLEELKRDKQLVEEHA
jgi:uncharacterized membrane protein YqjE